MRQRSGKSRGRGAVLALGVVLALAGCAPFPQLDAAISDAARQADYPVLIPAEGLLARRGDGRLTAETGADLLRRANNLRARAALLRRASIDDEPRRRLTPRLRRLGG